MPHALEKFSGVPAIPEIRSKNPLKRFSKKCDGLDFSANSSSRRSRSMKFRSDAFSNDTFWNADAPDQNKNAGTPHTVKIMTSHRLACGVEKIWKKLIVRPFSCAQPRRRASEGG